jgi:hypothetical protein
MPWAFARAAAATMSDMSSRAQWAGLAVVIGVIVVGLIALNWPAASALDRPAKTWVIKPGQTRRLSADQVLPEDRYECPGRPGIVIGTPKPGLLASAQGGILVTADDEGAVQMSCEASPA